MSSVLAVLDDTQVIVATDTLCGALIEGATSFFATKAFLLPHMNLIFAGSGASGFMDHWLDYLNTRKAFPGIDSMEPQCGEDMDRLWTQWRLDNPRPAGLETLEYEQVIYQFGLSEFTGEMLGFTHASWDHFRPEEISYRMKQRPMIIGKPECDVPEVESMNDVPKAFLAMMQQQRARQAADFYGTNMGGRVFIGGEMIIHHMNQTGCAVYKAARFDDYDQVERALWGDFRNARTY